MGEGLSASIVRDLETLFQGGVPVGLTDGQLLDRFSTGGAAAEAAFEAIVRRHGAMVLGVCRRVLGDAHAAEDAFQATFLVLASRAGAIRRRDSLGPWLHGVAARLAGRARLLARRQGVSRSLPELPAPDSGGGAAEIRPVLDEELGRLPEKYRRPVVLCYLEGLTQDEAARTLGWTKGTVSGRLARAKDLLRGRLLRRGLGPSAALVGLWPGAAAEALPVALVGSTVRAALAVALAFGRVEAGTVSASVLALVWSARRALLVGRLKAAASALLLLGALAGAVALGHADPEDRGPAPVEVKDAAVAEAGRLADTTLPRGARVRMGTTRLRHDQAVVRAVFSPDGRTLATTGLDGAVRFWDCRTGAPASGLGVLKEQGSPLAAAYSPDGRVLAVGRDDGTVQLWDVVANRERFRSEVHKGPVQGLAFAPDGRNFASASIGDTCVRIWEVAARKEIRTLALDEDADLGSLAFSHDGARLALASSSRSGAGETVRIWNVEAGGGPVLIRKAHGHSVVGLAFTAGGSELITSGTGLEPGKEESLHTKESAYLPQVRLWRVSDGRMLRELAPQGVTGQGGFALSHDGATLVTSHRERLLVWDLASGRVIRSIAVDAIRDAPQFGEIALAPDGRTLAALRGDRKVSLLDFASGNPLFPEVEGHRAEVLSVAFAPDGKMLATSGADSTVRLWETATGAHRRRLELGEEGWAWSACFSPDGKTLAAAGEYSTDDAPGVRGGIVRLWDLPDGRLRRELRLGQRAVHVVFSPDSRRLAVADWSGERNPTHAGAIGNRIHAGVSGSRIHVFDSGNGLKVFELGGQDSKIRAIAFAPDGATLTSTCSDGTFQFWDLATGAKPRRLFILGHSRADKARAAGRATQLASAAFAPDLTWAVTSGLWDDRLIVWELATGRQCQTIPVEKSFGSVLAVSPDGRLVASCSTIHGSPDGDDDDIHLWESATGRPLLRLETGGRWLRSLCFAPDGRSLGTAMNDSTALIWDIGAAYEQLGRSTQDGSEKR